MKHGIVDPKSWQSFKSAELNIITAVCASVSDDIDELTESATRVSNEIEQVYQRVKGNRSGCTLLTWSDVRRLLEADLRILLAELEKV